jgi:hypothetical protein
MPREQENVSGRHLPRIYLSQRRVLIRAGGSRITIVESGLVYRVTYEMEAKTYDFCLRRRVEGGQVRFSGLKVEKKT